jgi:hypothetical protein
MKHAVDSALSGLQNHVTGFRHLPVVVTFVAFTKQKVLEGFPHAHAEDFSGLPVRAQQETRAAFLEDRRVDQRIPAERHQLIEITRLDPSSRDPCIKRVVTGKRPVQGQIAHLHAIRFALRVAEEQVLKLTDLFLVDLTLAGVHDPGFRIVQGDGQYLSGFRIHQAHHALEAWQGTGESGDRLTIHNLGFIERIHGDENRKDVRMHGTPRVLNPIRGEWRELDPLHETVA